MSVLIIGGDKVSSIKKTLHSLGATKIDHWDARKKTGTCKKIIPYDIQCVIMLTTFLNHNVMKHFKSQSKKRDIPVVCSKSSASCVYQEYVKIMGITDCKDCYAYDECHKKG
jgi:hypothetical protein